MKEMNREQGGKPHVCSLHAAMADPERKDHLGNHRFRNRGFRGGDPGSPTWKKELAFFRRIPAAVCYAGILLREILRANLAVIRMVWRKKAPDPCLTTFSVPLKTTAARVALSDSITLTPGTITTDQDGDLLTVHCLDRTMAEGLETSCFVRRLQTMEKQEEKHEV